MADELAARQQVSVERIVAAVLAEQLSGWGHVQCMAELSIRTRMRSSARARASGWRVEIGGSIRR